MKKLRVILPGVACLFAGIGVFGTSLAPTYYVETSSGARTCSTISSISCPIATTVRCTFLADITDPTSTRWLTYKDPAEPNPTTCKPAFKAQ